MIIAVKVHNFFKSGAPYCELWVDVETKKVLWFENVKKIVKVVTSYGEPRLEKIPEFKIGKRFSLQYHNSSSKTSQSVVDSYELVDLDDLVALRDATNLKVDSDVWSRRIERAMKDLGLSRPTFLRTAVGSFVREGVSVVTEHGLHLFVSDGKKMFSIEGEIR